MYVEVMVRDLRRFALLVWLLGACAKRVGPVEPHVGGFYPRMYDGKNSRASTEGGLVVVGEPFEVHGNWSATCEKSAAPLAAKKDPSEYGHSYGSCDNEDADVVVRCSGPCMVHGIEVVPTAEGSLLLDVDLTSRKSARTARLTERLTAVDPHGFDIENFDADDDGKVVRVSTTAREVHVRVRTEDNTLIMPIHVDGVRAIPDGRGVVIPVGKPVALTVGAVSRTLTFTP
jgi:hypothetical protein